MKKMKRNSFILWVLVIITALGLLLYAFFTYVGGLNTVKGSSMEPLLKNDMQIYVSKLESDKAGVKQNSIIIYRLSAKNDSDFISRVVAVGGDAVKIQKASVYVNGIEYKVPGIQNPITTNFQGGFTKDGVTYVVPGDSVFVLGDNRMRSADSRDFGYIKRANIQAVYQYCYSNCQ
jgi:signal peptidase I